jgi:2-hydroxychromene-2-carboxylate isomerase
MTQQTAPEKIRAATASILDEEDEWRRIMAQDGAEVLKLYLDVKSPHAYLAVRPSLMVARDYSVKLDIQPYTLDYIGWGVSTSVDSDMRRRPANAAADRKARMYYAAARQYAGLQALPFRSPYRLLVSTAVHKAWLFARQQEQTVPFLMRVCLQGWGSGWRDYELESLKQLQTTLKEADVDLTGFEVFMTSGGEGDAALAACNAAAEATGVTGVPHYVFDDPATGGPLGLFGREHLALIREKFHAAGLARRPDVEPEFSHAWRGPMRARHPADKR